MQTRTRALPNAWLIALPPPCRTTVRTWPAEGEWHLSVTVAAWRLGAGADVLAASEDPRDHIRSARC